MKLFVVMILTVFGATAFGATAFAKSNSFTCASPAGDRATIEVKYPLIGSPSVKFTDRVQEIKSGLKYLKTTSWENSEYRVLSETSTIIIATTTVDILMPQGILDENPANSAKVIYIYTTGNLLEQTGHEQIDYDCVLK